MINCSDIILIIKCVFLKGAPIVRRSHHLRPQNSVWRIPGQNQILDVRNYNSYSLTTVTSHMISITTIYRSHGGYY